MREEAPKPVRQPGIHVQLRLNTAFLAQDAFVQQPFVAQGVHAADLEVGGREALVACGPEQGAEERVGGRLGVILVYPLISRLER